MHHFCVKFTYLTICRNTRASVSVMAFFCVTATLAITADGTSIYVVAAITPVPERVRNYKDLVSGVCRSTSIRIHLAMVSVCTHNVKIFTLRTLNLNSKQQQIPPSVQSVSNGSKQISFLRKQFTSNGGDEHHRNCCCCCCCWALRHCGANFADPHPTVTQQYAQNVRTSERRKCSEKQ